MRQGLVDNTYCNIKSLGPHLELKVKLGKPVYEVLPILLADLFLLALLQEVSWVDVSLFFLEHVRYDFGNEFDDCLRVSELKDVVDLKLVFISL